MFDLHEYNQMDHFPKDINGNNRRPILIDKFSRHEKIGAIKSGGTPKNMQAHAEDQVRRVYGLARPRNNLSQGTQKPKTSAKKKYRNSAGQNHPKFSTLEEE
jgi:hypothetical protein